MANTSQMDDVEDIDRKIEEQRKIDEKRHKKQKPKEMVTYWCPRCEMDSGRTDIDDPFCFMCGSGEGLNEIKREKLTREVMANRLKTVTDRMMDNLRKAYNIQDEEWPDSPEEEMMLLEALAHGQDLQSDIKKIANE